MTANDIRRIRKKEIIEELREEISAGMEGAGDEAVREFIIEKVLTMPELAELDAGECRDIVDYAFHSLRSDLSILQPYLEDDEISEIMVNGRRDIFVERRGNIERVQIVFEETGELEEVIRRAAAKVHKEINELHPVVDARLSDGSRVNAVYGNIAIGGPVMTIRKFPKSAFSMKDLIGFGTITEECAAFLGMLVRAGYNLFISGGTSSGKTTFLNVLSDFIPEGERVVVIEDSAELQIRNVENIVRMECRSENAEGSGKVDMPLLIRTALRMRPDRIIVGEVRGAEVMDMINAMNTGHDGSLSTGHGNSCEAMFKRLESMYLSAAAYPAEAIRSQIIEAVDVFIHLGRMPDMSRKVLSVMELCGTDEKGLPVFNEIFTYDAEKGLVPTGNRLKRTEKLRLRGVDPKPWTGEE